MRSTTPKRTHYDAIIVGARCAGSATAMLLARHGLSVLVLERSSYGSDTVSTHALMRPAVLQLSRWGVLDDLAAAGTPTIQHTTFHYGDEEIAIPIKPKEGVNGLCAPRRTVLDRALVDAAVAAGAEVIFGVTVVDLIRNSYDRVSGVAARRNDGGTMSFSADVVIGADGVRSTVARLAGAESYHHGRHATGCVYAYWQGLEVEGSHWYYRPGSAAGVIPTNDGATCVFVSVSDQRFRSGVRPDIEAGFDRVLSDCAPSLAASIGGRRSDSRLKAFAGIKGFFRKSWGPGWALVGDAGYFKDPLTAHGISDALRDAGLLARAVVDGSDSALVAYQTNRDYLSWDLFETTDRIASFRWSLDELKVLHLDLSEQMNHEADVILSHGDPRHHLPLSA